jgi:hypothetical protein
MVLLYALGASVKVNAEVLGVGLGVGVIEWSVE